LRIKRGADIAVGPGKVDLLEAIAATGSITAAAKRLGMSYRRAWLLVDTMNRCFTKPVVEAEAGGKRGGGARLTAAGLLAVRHYRRIERRAEKAAAADIHALQKLLRR
jgi:molybdate transport system regulatory protein